jgi:sensor histidine kinase regulating citrate/malate metabolism
VLFLKKTHSNSLLLFIGFIFTAIFSVVAIFVVWSEINYINTSETNHIKDIANVYSEDSNLVDTINNDGDVDAYMDHYYQVASDLSYIVIYDSDKTLLSSYKLNDDHTSFLNQIDTFTTKETMVVSPRLFGKNDIRIYKPILDEDEMIGVVGVVYLKEDLSIIKTGQSLRVLVIFIVGIASSWAGLWLYAAKYRSRLLGYQPKEIALLYSENRSLIDQLEQAVISVDKNCILTTINQHTTKLFGITQEDVGKPVRNVFTHINFKQIMENKERFENEYIKIDQHKLLMSLFPLYQGNNIIGATVTFRSYMEVDTLLNQLKGYRQIAGALRSQKHEFQNKLHVVLGLIKMKDYEKAENYITENVYKTNLASDYYSSRIKDDRVLALFIGKEIQCTEQGIHLLLTNDSIIERTHTPISSDDIVLVLGNLVDNSCDAYETYDEVDKKIVVDLFEDEETLKITVIDHAGGIDPSIKDNMFERGVSTKEGEARGTGLSLVNEIIHLHQGKYLIDSSKNETKIEIILMKVKS